MAKCIFDVAWRGICKEETSGENKVCEKHKLKKCNCGKQAIRECEETIIGSFVCGKLTCGNCTHSHW
jgi:hypothetical protein